MTIKWGLEIPVNGKRPEWLVDDEDVKCFTTVWHSHHLMPSGIDWPIIRAIRLRADHPHYQQAATDTVTIKRVSEDEFDAILMGEGTRSWFSRVGLLKSDAEVKVDRFMAAHPTADRATAEKALEWGREGA